MFVLTCDMTSIKKTSGQIIPGGGGGGGYLGSVLLGMCRWPLIAPAPSYSGTCIKRSPSGNG